MQAGLPVAIATVAMGCVLFAGACSWVLDTSITQCHDDNDCRGFAGTVCDVGNRVCVARLDAGTADARDGATADAQVSAPADVPAVDTVPLCTGPGGCFSCTPTDEAEILSRCTDTVCVPFDNHRLNLMADDGYLRSLP